nr:LysR family transcriptional regulator [Candidimonas nitroreducens]
MLLQMIDTHRSLRKVGEAMHLTQPAITAMLNDLEQAFEVSLVARDRQGAMLTPAGIATKARLAALLNELHAARDANIASASGHYLRIGVLPAAMIDLIPEVIALIKQRGVDLVLKFTESTVEHAMEALYNNELDCVIGRVDAKSLSQLPYREFSFEKLLATGLKLACSPDNEFGKRPSITLDDLVPQNWALLSIDSQTRNTFDQAFIQNGLVPPTPVVESLSFFSNLHLVSVSDFLTIAPATAVARFEKLKMIRQIAFEWPISPSPLLLITRNEKNSIDSLARFRTMLKACAAHL